MWNESRNNVTHCHFTRFSKFKIYIYGLEHWECMNKLREKSPWNVAGIIFLDSIFRCCTLSFHKNVKIREVKTVQKAQAPIFCRKNDVIDDVSQNLWHHFFYKNVMGPRTFYGAKLLISRSFEKNLV